MIEEMNESIREWVTSAGGGVAEQRRQRECSEVRMELLRLIGEGLLEFSVDPITGESVFWATPMGEVLLGMN